jgi:hypothetical protein
MDITKPEASKNAPLDKIFPEPTLGRESLQMNEDQDCS